MRRRTRKSLVHVSLFSGVLILILYLGRAQSDSEAFAWNTIRYKSTSFSVPEARGICSGLATSSKPALVVSRVTADGDSRWLDGLAALYHLCVYAVDAPDDGSSSFLTVPANRGHEAMAYLTFIIDNYAHIPPTGVVFVHGSRWAWHNDAPDYDNAALLRALNLSSALAPWGYHNLRCDWSASTCSPSSGSSQGSLETSFNAVLQPWSARAASDAALPGALATSSGTNGHPKDQRNGKIFLGRTETVRAQCCAQFAVARDNVWQHSRGEYVALRQWSLDGSSGSGAIGDRRRSSAAPSDDRVAGRILSYVWHILFMPQENIGNAHNSASSADYGVQLKQLNRRACPRADECYCRLYGRCNLDGCTSPEQCYRQYRLPPNLQLPDDWASTHS